MKDSTITSILRHVRCLAPEDGLTKAATVFQMAQLQSLPVSEGDKLVGLISEKALLANVGAGSGDSITVAHLMDANPTCISLYSSVGQSAGIMNSLQVETLPVIDEFGSYCGIITRSDVLAAMFDIVKPPSIGGMATPLGVRLTTGGVSAGAGSLGLFLTGFMLMIMAELARGTLWVGAFLADKAFKLHILAMAASPPINKFLWVDVVSKLKEPLQLLLLLVFLRFSPLAAYHAAEHQTVHAIENGEPLTPEAVSRMPRVHPRCGTNLMIVASIFLLTSLIFGADYGVLVGLALAILGWRKPGSFVQQYFTTKPAAPKYIQNGIKVGEELMAKYRRQPYVPTTVLGRLWEMGFPQIILGFAAVAMIDKYIFPLIGLASSF